MSDSQELTVEAIVLPPNPEIRDALGRFVPGVAPNPGGRPKRKLISDALRDQLEQAIAGGDMTQAEEIAASMVKQAVKGRVDAATFVRDTTEGKPVQAVLVGHAMDESTASRLADLAEALRLNATQRDELP